MVTIPPIKMVIWGMVYYCFTHVMHIRITLDMCLSTYFLCVHLWRFPKIGLPPVLIHFNRIHYKPSILRATTMAKETSTRGFAAQEKNSEDMTLACGRSNAWHHRVHTSDKKKW